MTREEEISNAAFEYIKSDAVKAGEEYISFGDFIEGAKWADSHPHWISVEDELPPRFVLDPSVSMNVLTYGLRTIVSWYYYDKDVWAGNTEVTHWMPLPSPPKEISGNNGEISPKQPPC